MAYDRGENQKPVTRRYLKNWETIWGPKNKANEEDKEEVRIDGFPDQVPSEPPQPED